MINVNIRMDESLKQQFEFYCNEIGLNMTSAVNVFARAVVREGGIPFDLKVHLPNADTLAAIQESEALLANPNASRFDSIDDLFEELNS